MCLRGSHEYLNMHYFSLLSTSSAVTVVAVHDMCPRYSALCKAATHLQSLCFPAGAAVQRQG